MASKTYRIMHSFTVTCPVDVRVEDGDITGLTVRVLTSDGMATVLDENFVDISAEMAMIRERLEREHGCFEE